MDVGIDGVDLNVQRVDVDSLDAQGAGAFLAHGVHLAPAELEEAQDRGASLLHNPRSNMNNDVGYAPTHAFRRAALGTDGMDGDVLAEARVAFLKLREAGRDPEGSQNLRLDIPPLPGRVPESQDRK